MVVSAYPPVIACRKLVLNVTLRASLIEDCGKTCKCESTDSAVSYALKSNSKCTIQQKEQMKFSAYFVPSAVTQAAIVVAGIADSSQRRFMTNCRSNGPNKLPTAAVSACHNGERSYTNRKIDRHDDGRW